MRKSLRVAILGSGMLSLLMGANTFAAQSLESDIAKIKGMDAAGKRAAAKALTAADRKAMHAEYKALSPDAQKALRADLVRGQKASNRGAKRGTVGTVQYDTGTPHTFRDNSPTGRGQPVQHRLREPPHHQPDHLQPERDVLAGRHPGPRVQGAGRNGGAGHWRGRPSSARPASARTSCGTCRTWSAHNGTFLGGVQQSGSLTTINTTFVGINVDVNNGGQGFHGMTISLAGNGFNPNATVAPGQAYNAIFRATGTTCPWS